MGGTYPTTNGTVPRGTVTSHQPPPQPQHPEPPAIDTSAAPTTLPHPYSAPDGEPCHHRRPVLREIPLSQITVSPGANPRTQFDDAGLEALAASIEHDGLLQPIIVRPGPGPLPSWVLLAGERRLRAAKLAKLTTLPALIRGVHDPRDPREPLLLALTENLHRADLNPIDEARALLALHMAGLSQAELGRRLGRAAPTIANSLRLVTHLPAEVQDQIAAGQLSAAHGRALARYHPYTAVQRQLAAWTRQHQWSSHLLEGTTLPNATDLIRAGLAASPWTHTEPWRSLCPACPYAAYRGGYCLKPEHEAALRQEYRDRPSQPTLPAPSTSTPPPPPAPATTLPRGKEAAAAPARQAPTPVARSAAAEDPPAALAARRQDVAARQAAARTWIERCFANPGAPLQLTLHQERAISLLALLALRPMHRDSLHAALRALRSPHQQGAHALIRADLTDLYGPHERFPEVEHLGTTTWLAVAVEALLSHEAELDPANTPWADWLIDGQAPTPTAAQETTA